MTEQTNRAADFAVGAAGEAGNDKPFEENMARLEALVRQLERGELTLEEALACYQEGVALVGYCQQSLERTAKAVEILTEGLAKT